MLGCDVSEHSSCPPLSSRRLLGADATPGSVAGAGHHGPWGHGHGGALSWTETVVDADQSFRGLDAVDRRTAWVTGGSATEGGPGRVFRTTDGGRTWQDVSPPGTEGLLFRDVEARSAKAAVILAIGPGDASRIYRTTDGGASWDAAFVNDDPAAFYDCMAFYPGGRRGLAMSDPVDGKFRILATEDSGRSWTVLPDDGMPEAADRVRLRRQRRLPRHDRALGVLRLRRRRRAGLPLRRPRPDLDRHRLDDPGRRGRRRLRPGVPYAAAGGRRRRRLRGPGRRCRRRRGDPRRPHLAQRGRPDPPRRGRRLPAGSREPADRHRRVRRR